MHQLPVKISGENIDQVNGFLRRKLHQCPVTVKSNCYKMMVRPIVEYASSVWAPHTLGNINQLEFIQRRAARFSAMISLDIVVSQE